MKLGALSEGLPPSPLGNSNGVPRKNPVTYNAAGSFLRLRRSYNLMLVDGSDALDGPGKRRQDDHGRTHQSKAARHADRVGEQS